MTFSKTVLVPAECAKDMSEAMDMVDTGVEDASIDLFNQQPNCESFISCKADKNGLIELADDIAKGYQILNNRILE